MSPGSTCETGTVSTRVGGRTDAHDYIGVRVLVRMDNKMDKQCRWEKTKCC